MLLLQSLQLLFVLSHFLFIALVLCPVSQRCQALLLRSIVRRLSAASLLLDKLRHVCRGVPEVFGVFLGHSRVSAVASHGLPLSILPALLAIRLEVAFPQLPVGHEKQRQFHLSFPNPHFRPPAHSHSINLIWSLDPLLPRERNPVVSCLPLEHSAHAHEPLRALLLPSEVIYVQIDLHLEKLVFHDVLKERLLVPIVHDPISRDDNALQVIERRLEVPVFELSVLEVGPLLPPRLLRRPPIVLFRVVVVVGIVLGIIVVTIILVLSVVVVSPHALQGLPGRLLLVSPRQKLAQSVLPLVLGRLLRRRPL
mmetsp:Transcript_6726/g.12297  ORF Transcript_6726/g.12297 Transcript_6726/m.12297 type:complete len:310 (+) Transcript_6726:557-1486(+)